MEVRDCAKFVKVVIEKVDDRNAERIVRTEILDRFVTKSPPTDVPVMSNGLPIILTTWLLTSQTTLEDNWESTQVGFDQFTQTQPTPESIEQAKIRCRRSHHKLA